MNPNTHELIENAISILLIALDAAGVEYRPNVHKMLDCIFENYTSEPTQTDMIEGAQ